MVIAVGDHIRISVELLKDLLTDMPEHSLYKVRVKSIEWFDDGDGGFKNIVLQREE